jgi:hypothetical protein
MLARNSKNSLLHPPHLRGWTTPTWAAGKTHCNLRRPTHPAVPLTIGKMPQTRHVIEAMDILYEGVVDALPGLQRQRLQRRATLFA